MERPPTVLDYYEDMWKLQTQATFLGSITEEPRLAIILERTVFHPQGGGQPADQGFITDDDRRITFVVEDVRLKNGQVYHYGFYAQPNGAADDVLPFEKGQKVSLSVDENRRKLNSRLHSAGHLLDLCMRNIGLSSLEPGKGHHFPDGPFVEYKGIIPSEQLNQKRTDLEDEINKQVSLGGNVKALVVLYKEAEHLCGGKLPDYISKDSKPRIVTLGDNFGCPCGGTHVQNISEIGQVKVPQIRVKKGVTKVSYYLVDCATRPI